MPLGSVRGYEIYRWYGDKPTRIHYALDPSNPDHMIWLNPEEMIKAEPQAASLFGSSSVAAVERRSNVAG